MYVEFKGSGLDWQAFHLAGGRSLGGACSQGILDFSVKALGFGVSCFSRQLFPFHVSCCNKVASACWV